MQKSTTVLSVPMADLEAQLADVESWALFLPGLSGVERTSSGRFTFTVLQDGREYRLPVAVRRSPRGHGLLWTTIEGPAWNGHLHLEAVDARRTRVHLELVIDPRTFLGHLVDLIGDNDKAQLGLARLRGTAAAAQAPTEGVAAR